MSARTRTARDPFAFSLGATVSLNSHVFVPAIADDALNRAWRRKLERRPDERPDLIREIEDFLARYFAPVVEF